MFSPYGGFGSLFFMYYLTSLSTAFIMAGVYFIPLVQLIVSGDRKNWLKRHFEENPTADEHENAFRKKLIIEASPKQAYPLYKLLKFYLLSAGIMALVIGFLTMIWPDSMMNDNGSRILVIVPLLVGISIYFLYKKIFLNHGLWREIAATFLLLGVAVTFLGAYELYEIDEVFRSDLYLYLILGFGLFVVRKFNSTVASLLYLGLVWFGSSFVMENVGDNWMFFMTHFIWFFALASLSFWLPRLRAAKEIEFREILFGILFSFVILTLGFKNTSGLGALAVSVLLPCLYIFSKIYFKRATWFGAKPIETLLVLGLLLTLAAFSLDDTVYSVHRQITIFENMSFHKIVAFFIIIIAAITANIMYSDQTGKDQKSINLYVVFAPLGLFLLVYLLGDYGTQYLANIFLLFLGFDYLRKGLLAKDAVQLTMAVLVIVASISVRLYDVAEFFNDRFISGLTVMVYGLIFSGLALYMRDKWTVTAPNSDSTSEPLEENRFD